jgi:hypothetical protein
MQDAQNFDRLDGRLTPTVLQFFGFRLFFYSLENGEPSHIHVEDADMTAKYWLNPVELSRS